MRIVCFSLIFLGCLAGCTANNSSPSSESAGDAIQSADVGVQSAKAPSIEISPAARRQILGVIKANSIEGRWWLRVTVKPGGCTGITESVDLDPSGAGPGDVEMLVGDIRCVFAKSDELLIQGVRIDWNEDDVIPGFKMTYPNRTKENQTRVAKIISEALKDAPSP